MNVDLLITGGMVVTMDPGRRVIERGAVAVNHNRIVAVGTAEELEFLYTATRYMQASGRMILPGFVNLHSHTALAVIKGIAEDKGSASLYGLMMPVQHVMTEEDVYHMTILGMCELVRFGTTTVVENYHKMDAVAQAAERIGIRAFLSETIADADLLAVETQGYKFDSSRIDQGLKRSADFADRWHGKAEGRIRVQFSPHACDTCSPELLKAVGQEARRRGLGITMHVAQRTGEVAQVQKAHGCGSVELLERTGLLGPDLIAAHAIYLSDREIGLMASTQTAMSHNAAINSKRGRVAPAIDLLERGGVVGIGTDNMHSNITEAWKLAIAVARIRKNDGTKLQPMEVLEMVTINGAKAVGLADQIGSLEPGKLADIVVVDMRKPHLYPLIHPIGAFVHNVLGSDIETVIIDGRVVVEAGEVLTQPVDVVLESAQRTAESVWKQLRAEFPIP